MHLLAHQPGVVRESLEVAVDDDDRPVEPVAGHPEEVLAGLGEGPQHEWRVVQDLSVGDTRTPAIPVAFVQTTSQFDPFQTTVGST